MFLDPIQEDLQQAGGCVGGVMAWWRSEGALLCEVLTRFCRAYAAGSLTTHETALWSSVCLVPLDKGGGKIRPIALGEALPKLAQATLIDTIAPQLRSTLEPRQLSVRVPGGAETLARALRAWMLGE